MAKQDLELDLLPVPDARCLTSLPERVAFDSGKSAILPASTAAIEAVSQIMLEVPGMKVAIVGYADGEEHDGVQLSRARATAVVGRIVAREVASSRLFVVARGADNPVVLGGSEEERAANRRVIFVVTDCSGKGNFPPASLWLRMNKTCHRGDAGAPVSAKVTDAGRAEAGSDGGTKLGLPAELIQAVIRQHEPAVRQCYRDGLVRNPQLQGKLSTRFVINLDGTVSDVSAQSSTLPDPQTVRCVMDVCLNFCFPHPEGGVVTVIMPTKFQSLP